ncbi:hypothetical protein Bbelb_109700 [Branchiostoma belcheri]|nr:hypothetical protein Bbelb_109700 [Branchiostoma belcheri]
MAGRSTRASTRGKTTKWWNIAASKLPADETLHVDFDDEAKTSPCDTKFVTTTDRVPIWVETCKVKYNEEYGKQTRQSVKWRQENHADVLVITDTDTIDGKPQEVCALSIHFWKNGTIIIQGTSFMWWSDKIFPELKKRSMKLWKKENKMATQAEVTPPETKSPRPEPPQPTC